MYALKLMTERKGCKVKGGRVFCLDHPVLENRILWCD